MVRKLSNEKREKFLGAALKLFVSKGVANTSTAEIAKEAGTAAGTLFLYFPTKQDLLNELVLTIGRQQSEHILNLLEPTHTAHQIFYTIWNGTVNWFLSHLEAYQYVLQVRDSGMISASTVNESNQFFGYYYAAIQKGLVEGSIKAYPLELIGAFLYQDIVATINLLRMQADSGTREETIQQGFEIFWNGIKSKELP